MIKNSLGKTVSIGIDRFQTKTWLSVGTGGGNILAQFNNLTIGKAYRISSLNINNGATDIYGLSISYEDAFAYAAPVHASNENSRFSFTFTSSATKLTLRLGGGDGGGSFTGRAVLEELDNAQATVVFS